MIDDVGTGGRGMRSNDAEAVSTVLHHLWRCEGLFLACPVVVVVVVAGSWLDIPDCIVPVVDYLRSASMVSTFNTGQR